MSRHNGRLTGSSQRSAAVAGTLVTLLITFLVLRQSLGPGVLLFRDDVQVPSPEWNDAVFGVDGGPPRSVPFSAVMYGVSQLAGASLAQRLVLAAPLLLVGTGVSVLLRRHGALASSVGALVSVWNPYVVERLGLGQAPTLLAYGALPWLLVATSVRASARRLAARSVLAFVPAALTPIGSVLGLATITGALRARRTPVRAAALVVVGPLLMCAPWVVAGLLAPVAVAQPDGAAAYAARSDGPWGLVVSVATLGGVWTPTAVPLSRAEIVPTVASLVLIASAVVGWLRHRHARWLLAGWLVPVAAVTFCAADPAMRLLERAQQIPGLGLLRDTHRLLAPAAMVVALGVPMLIAELSRLASSFAPPSRRWPVAVSVRAGMAVALAGGCLLTVPDLAATVGRQYQPVVPPRDWQQAQRLVGSSEGTVLSLPWQPLRRTAWNRGVTFLDPLPLAAGGRTLRSTQLQVRRGERLLVTDEDAVPPSPGWLDGRIDAGDLQHRGVTWVVEDRASPGPEVVTKGLQLVLDGPTTRVWRVPGGETRAGMRVGRAAVAAGLAVAGGVLVAALMSLALGRWGSCRRECRRGHAGGR